MIAIAALSVLAITGTIMNSREAAAQGRPKGLAVRIVNTAPVPVSGTGCRMDLSGYYVTQ